MSWMCYSSTGEDASLEIKISPSAGYSGIAFNYTYCLNIVLVLFPSHKKTYSFCKMVLAKDKSRGLREITFLHWPMYVFLLYLLLP